MIDTYMLLRRGIALGIVAIVGWFFVGVGAWVFFGNTQIMKWVVVIILGGVCAACICAMIVGAVQFAWELWNNRH